MEDITVFVAPHTLDDIETRLEYGDSRSEWIREAIRQRLDKEQ
jgi:Arc/MetJ-type ribon-helix-helix transcriptional regulator